jgi:hypothetical protein
MRVRSRETASKSENSLNVHQPSLSEDELIDIKRAQWLREFLRSEGIRPAPVATGGRGAGPPLKAVVDEPQSQDFDRSDQTIIRLAGGRTKLTILSLVALFACALLVYGNAGGGHEKVTRVSKLAVPDRSVFPKVAVLSAGAPPLSRSGPEFDVSRHSVIPSVPEQSLDEVSGPQGEIPVYPAQPISPVPNALIAATTPAATLPPHSSIEAASTPTASAHRTKTAVASQTDHVPPPAKLVPSVPAAIRPSALTAFQELPAGAAIHLVIVYSSREAVDERQANAFAEKLRSQLPEVASSVVREGQAESSSVDYFFPNDRDAAQTVVNQLAHLTKRAEPVELVHTKSLPRPGTIDVLINPQDWKGLFNEES